MKDSHTYCETILLLKRMTSTSNTETNGYSLISRPKVCHINNFGVTTNRMDG